MSIDTDRDDARRATATAQDEEIASRRRPRDAALRVPLLDDDAGDVALLGRRRVPEQHDGVNCDPAPARPRLRRERASCSGQHSRRPRLLLAASVALVAVLTLAAVAIGPVFVVSDPPPRERRVSPDTAVNDPAMIVKRREQVAQAARARASAERREAEQRQRALRRRVAARRRALIQRVTARQRRERRERRERAASRRRAPPTTARAPRTPGAPAAQRATSPAPAAPARPRAVTPPSRPPAPPPLPRPQACGDFDFC